MSVAAYVREANLGIQKEIQKRLDYISAHPYPTDELKKASENKKKYKGYQLAIADLFGIYSPNGQIGDDPNTLDPEKLNAIKEGAEKISPGLWTRLQEGQRGLDKKNEIEEYLKNINPEAELTEEFDKFYSTILNKQKEDPKITFDQVFAAGVDDIFVDMLGLKYNIYINLNSFGADGLVKAAFKELYDKKKSPITSKPSEVDLQKNIKTQTSTINEKQNEADIQKNIKTQTSPINEKPKPESTVVKTKTPTKSEGTINDKTSNTTERTSVTTSEGLVTSKPSEVIEEKPKLEEKKSPSININLENKPLPKEVSGEFTMPSSSVSNSSTSSTINSTENVSSVTNSPDFSSNYMLGGGKTKNILNVDKTSTTSNVSNMVDESDSKKKKGGFLSKLGKFAESTASVLNLPSLSEMGSQAKELFGVTSANISSRVSEVKESFKNNPINLKEDIGFKKSSTEGSSTNVSSESSKNESKMLSTTVDNTSSTILKKNKTDMLKMEQSNPTMINKESSSNVSSPSSSTSSSSNVSTTNVNASQPTARIEPEKPREVLAQPSSEVSVNVDINQLASKLDRIERALINGIEVTIKEA